MVMIGYLKKEDLIYKKTQPFSCIAGYAAVKKELSRLLYLLKLKSKEDLSLGIVITGAANNGKYYMAQALAAASDLPVLSPGCSSESKDPVPEVVDFLDTVDNTGHVLLLVRHLDQWEERSIEQLKSCLDDCGKKVTVLATAEEIDGPAAYAKELGLITHSIPIGAPTLNDTAAFLEFLFNKKYRDIYFNIPAEDMASVMSRYSFSLVDSLIHDSIISARLDHTGEVDLDRLMEAVMRHEFHMLSVTEDFPENKLREACVHEAGHALAGILVGVNIGYACICRHGKSEQIGYTSILQDSVDYRYTPAGMMIGLAGIVAEEICNGYISVGAKSDIRNVTDALKESIVENGVFGIEYVDPIYNYASAPEYRTIREEKILKELGNLYEETTKLLLPYKGILLTLSDLLLRNEYLLGSKIKETAER